MVYIAQNLLVATFQSSQGEMFRLVLVGSLIFCIIYEMRCLFVAVGPNARFIIQRCKSGLVKKNLKPYS